MPAKEPRKSVQAVQVGNVYRVTSCTNFFELDINQDLTQQEAAALVARGIIFTYKGNK